MYHHPTLSMLLSAWWNLKSLMLIVTGAVQGRTLGPPQDTRCSLTGSRLLLNVARTASGQPARPAEESSICAFLPAANIQLSVTH